MVEKRHDGEAMSETAQEVLRRIAEATAPGAVPDLIVTRYQLTHTGTALPVLDSRAAAPDYTYHLDPSGQVWREDVDGLHPLYVVDHPGQTFTRATVGPLTPLLPLDAMDAAHAEYCGNEPADVDQESADVDQQPADPGRHRLVISNERLHGARATYWAALDDTERRRWLDVAGDSNNAYSRVRHWTNFRCMSCAHFPPCQCPDTGQYGTHTGLHSGNHYATDRFPTVAHRDPWEPHITLADRLVDATYRKPLVANAVKRWARLERIAPKTARYAIAGAIGETNSVCRSTGMAAEDDTESDVWCSYAIEAYFRIRRTEDTPDVPQNAE